MVSCIREKQGAIDEMAPLYPPPQVITLNTQPGYSINPITGDSIQPVINSFNDTVITGVPVPVRGKVVDPARIAKPKVVPAGEPMVVQPPSNVYKIPENLTVIPVNKEFLKTITLGEDTSSFVLVNSTEDTVPTGVEIPCRGKIVPCIQPLPVKTLPLSMKDNATGNMRYLGVEHGMSSSTILSILEDSRGNLWFGSHSEGVILYN
jgi:hypothetical protein